MPKMNLKNQRPFTRNSTPAATLIPKIIAQLPLTCIPTKHPFPRESSANLSGSKRLSPLRAISGIKGRFCQHPRTQRLLLAPAKKEWGVLLQSKVSFELRHVCGFFGRPIVASSPLFVDTGCQLSAGGLDVLNSMVCVCGRLLLRLPGRPLHPHCTAAANSAAEFPQRAEQRGRGSSWLFTCGGGGTWVPKHRCGEAPARSLSSVDFLPEGRRGTPIPGTKAPLPSSSPDRTHLDRFVDPQEREERVLGSTDFSSYGRMRVRIDFAPLQCGTC